MDFIKSRPGGLEKTTTTISMAATPASHGTAPLVIDLDTARDVHRPVGYELALLDTPPTIEPILPDSIGR